MLTRAERTFVERILDHSSPERLAGLIHHPYIHRLLRLRARELADEVAVESSEPRDRPLHRRGSRFRPPPPSTQGVLEAKIP